MEMKDRILEGALDLYSRYGQSRVSMEEIAAYLNISKKTIYNHYKNKTALFHEALNYYARRLVDEMQNIINDTEHGFAERLHGFLTHSYMELGRKDPRFFEDLRQFNEGLEDSPLLFVRSRMAEIITVFIDSAKEEGIISGDIHTQNTTYVFLTIMNGIISWDLRDQMPISRVEILKSTIKIALEGLLTDKGREILKETLDE
ncbi:MAG: TetR/AcrR family transcriptional regulator [Spirochaetales bacterium]|nr:TetR/AcrR family transcriptional regulator [Spirochaetales bacterium]